MSNENKNEKRNRTISWAVEVDQLAVRLAALRGYVQTEGGVGQFLADLVKLESLGDPESGFKKQLPTIREEITRLQEKSRSYKKSPK